MAINYEFLNNLMSDPDLADWIRSKEIGYGAGVPNGPYGPRQPEPDYPYGPFNPDDLPKPEAVMPPAVPEIARPPMPPPPAQDSPAGQILDMQPGGPSPASLEFEGPGGTLLTGSNRPENHLPDVQPPGGRGFKGFLARALPRMATAAIAAGATPSRYGGGPLDIFQGMQAGQQELERRDMMAYEMARRRGLDDLNRRKIESDIGRDTAQNEVSKAQTEYYKAQANQKVEKKASDVLFDDYRNEKDPELKEKKKDLWLQSIGHAAKPEKLWVPGKIAGTLVNRETNEVKWIDETAARAARDEEMRKYFNVAPELWPYRKNAIFAQQPDVDQYIKYGHEGLKKGAGAGANAVNTPFEALMMGVTKPGMTKEQIGMAAWNEYNKPRITAAEIADQRRQAAQNKAFLNKAQSEYQKALNDAEDDYRKAKAAIDKPGVRPGTADPKNPRRPVASDAAAWDAYNEKDAVIRKQLLDAKNAAHRAFQAAQAEYDPEHFRASPGYDQNARPIPVPGEMTDPTAAKYLEGRKAVKKRPGEIGILDFTTR